MKKRRKRWSCPICAIGALGPQRPRKDNAVRYCLPCTAKTGKLVERVSVADINKKKAAQEHKKAAQEDRRVARKANPKPRKTKRSWMQDKRYIHDTQHGVFNMMEISEKMCASPRWDKVISKALEKSKITRYFIRYNAPLESLWDDTMKQRGKGTAWTGGIRIRRGSDRGGASGRGGPSYGVTMTTCPSISDNIITLLHELVHVIRERFPSTKTGDKRRPHDLLFNLILCGMAKSFFGYPYSPKRAGYSVGKGYAPTWHMQSWLRTKIVERDPRVLKWTTGGSK